MLEHLGPGFNPRWFSERQYRHLLNAVKTKAGAIRVLSYYQIVRERVVAGREQSFTSGEVIRYVMSQTRTGFPGSNDADLLPITRGMLTTIFRELDDAGD